jgi:hypothetical protein
MDEGVGERIVGVQLLLQPGEEAGKDDAGMAAGSDGTLIGWYAEGERMALVRPPERVLLRVPARLVARTDYEDDAADGPLSRSLERDHEHSEDESDKRQDESHRCLLRQPRRRPYSPAPPRQGQGHGRRAAGRAAV